MRRSPMRQIDSRRGRCGRLPLALLAACAMLLAAAGASPGRRARRPDKEAAQGQCRATRRGGCATTASLTRGSASIQPNRPAELEGPRCCPRLAARTRMRTVQTVALFGLISLAPIALLDGDGLRADQHRADPAAPGPGQPAGTGQPGLDRARALADGPGHAAARRARLQMPCALMPPTRFQPPKPGRPAASRSRHSWSSRSF